MFKTQYKTLNAFAYSGGKCIAKILEKYKMCKYNRCLGHGEECKSLTFIR